MDCARFRCGGAGPLELIVCAVCHPGSTKALHTLLAAPFENNGLELCRRSLVLAAQRSCRRRVSMPKPTLVDKLTFAQLVRDVHLFFV